MADRSRFPSYPPDTDPRLRIFLEALRAAVEDVVVGDIAIELASVEGTLSVDTIAEYTSAAGVTIDSVLIKDGAVTLAASAALSADVISEVTGAAGVTIDSCLIKDGAVSDAGISESSVTQHEGAIDHGNLLAASLGHDDHSIYALLAGRSGGQTLIGGTGSGDDLTLQSTSNATRGHVQISDECRLGDDLMRRTANDSYLRVQGGLTNGAQLDLHGASYGSNGNDIVFRVGGTEKLRWDDSDVQWEFAENINLASSKTVLVNGTQVLTARQTGWTASTGTAARGAYATFSSQTVSDPPTQTEVQNIDDHVVILSQQLKALKDDLITHGVIGS